MSQTIGLPEREVYVTFGSTYAAQGDTLARAKKVSQGRLDLKLQLLTGEVQGSQIRPYKVRIQLNSLCSKILSAGCSCPMGSLCKHAAALAFHAIREGLIPRSESVVPMGAGGPASAQASAGAGRAPGPGSASIFGQQKNGPASMLSPNVSRWVAALNSAMSPQANGVAKGNASARKATAELADCVLYFLEESAGRLLLKCVHAKRLKTGVWGATQAAEIGRIAQRGAQYITDEDADICTLFERARGDTTWTYRDRFPEIPEICAVLIERIIATERCFWKGVQSPIATFGPPKKAQLRWDVFDDGGQMLKFSAGSRNDITVLAGGVYYVNPAQGILGPLITAVPPDAVKTILHSPRVSSAEAVALSEAMHDLAADIPRPVAKFTTREEVLKPTPKIALRTVTRQLSRWADTIADEKYTQAELTFDYGGIKFDQADNTECRTVSGDEIWVQKRDLSAEAEIVEQVKEYNLGDIDAAASTPTKVVFRSSEDDGINWFKFVQAGVPELSKQGFVVEVDNTFNYDIVVPEEEWDADATAGSDFWFSLDLGVTVEGRRVPLLPVIHQAIKRLRGQNPLAEIDRLNVEGKFYAPLGDGRFVALPFNRVKAVVLTLLEIFDRDLSLTKPTVQVNLPQMMELAQVFAGAAVAKPAGEGDDISDFNVIQLDAEGNDVTNGKGWVLSPKLTAFLDKIKTFAGFTEIIPPQNFQATLRPYQLEGLSWLNFIREFGLGGILADDMGLGKTIQALAHIACEKEAGRVDKPFLVICPTSVLPNWLSEIQKFAPHFKALGLSGSARSDDFDKIASVDIVVTSYPLVSRDSEVLIAQRWQAVILDEAQYIKNPQTQVAQAVTQLRSDYRLCLSGTPIENHLGELWSQFNFLMPGFLRDLTTFNKTVRTPIEKHKNLAMQQHLTAKVRPFLLRRTKELVAKDLPPKTVITKSVELEGAQRDLYETVRLAMYEKVQDALAIKGLAKSQIVILDAMLKLRQVCCDPRLVKLPSARQVDSSAKLTQLLEMIEELLSEGKRILLFSQFTSMLDLIMPELESRQIDFVQIRGDTKDRATPVQRFQDGQVPLFLLSLKAGGTGLNLTAADTVIHYDPWWNPAVENQATDRAHRIGQDKNVFVFKLIAAGTIEEKMIELQDKKRAIADAIYGDEEAIASKLTAEDLESLFKPLS